MNSRQKEAYSAQLLDEKRTIRELRQVYKKALDDVNDKIAILDGRTDLVNVQSIVYQRQYQEAIKKQLESAMDVLNSEEFEKISDYLGKSYENGFLGAMYDLHGQGVPFLFPIDPEQVAKALRVNSKISEGLYAKLGVNTKELKDSIRANLSRGISSGASWETIAKTIDKRMNVGLNRAIRIVRTEGHRIGAEASYNAQLAANAKGADIVKQWDSTLDNRTRPSHRRLDGQIRELEEPFEVNGHEAMFPGAFGVAKEDVNCRCAILQRASWGLDETELATMKERAKFYNLDKTQDFEDFKKKYLKLPPNADRIDVKVSSEAQALCDSFETYGAEYREVALHSTPLSESEIIDVLGGGDRTSGSCSSLGLAYIGQKGGLDVLDFRGGKSLDCFSSHLNVLKIATLPKAGGIFETARNSTTAGNKLLKSIGKGKEYYLACGRHAAIVRRTDDDVLQYLELQTRSDNGWHDFDGNARFTLSTRFGEVKGTDYTACLIDVDSFKDSADIRKLLGYINTSANAQNKGVGGYAK